MITLVAVLVVLAVSMWPVDGLRVTPLRKPPREAEAVTLLAELTALGLSAGHSFAQALGEASARVPGSVGDQARSVLREARNAGLAVALQRVSGDAAGLYRAAARASLTGAPLGPSVQAHIHELRAAERLRRLERVRKLPVKMLFPLALLILPGFVILTVAPTLFAALDRLRF